MTISKKPSYCAFLKIALNVIGEIFCWTNLHLVCYMNKYVVNDHFHMVLENIRTNYWFCFLNLQRVVKKILLLILASFFLKMCLVGSKYLVYILLHWILWIIHLPCCMFVIKKVNIWFWDLMCLFIA